jgi:hypothetical protein
MCEHLKKIADDPKSLSKPHWDKEIRTMQTEIKAAADMLKGL